VSRIDQSQALARAGQAPADERKFFELGCAWHVSDDATVGVLVADAHSLVSSAVGVLSLMDLENDAMHALMHLLRQADGLLSVAHTLHEQECFAAQSKGGAA